MCSLKLSVFVILTVAGGALAAPKPNLEEFGRKVREFGQKALPAVRGVCGFVNSYQGYPQNPGFPQSAGYPQFRGSFPQYPNYYPQYPQNVGPVTPNVPASPNFPPTQGQVPTGGGSEQDDLNKGIPSANSQNVPPQIQDVFNNFDKLPRFNNPALVGNKNIIDWESSDNNVI